MAQDDIITPEDVANRSNGTVDPGDTRMEPYIADIYAEATLYAPCLLRDDLSPVKIAQARGILCDAVLRRFTRDEEPPQGSGLAAETWTSGPFGRTLNYADNNSSGLPFLTTADRDMLGLICTGASNRTRSRTIPIKLPTVHDPTQSGWPDSWRVG